MKQLFCDCKTDEEKSNFFLSGRAVESGVIAPALVNDVAMAYHRCAEFKKENDTLRAKVAEMEKQEPVAFALYSGWAFKAAYHKEHEACDQRDRRQLSADLGGSIEAYRVVPLYALPGAQNVPSFAEGWLRAIDEALVVAHIGVANESDTYEQANAKLNNLIGFHVDIATDPAVNGGWKLVPIVSTHEMDYAGSSHCDGFLSTAQAVWDTMLAVAPGAKP